MNLPTTFSLSVEMKMPCGNPLWVVTSPEIRGLLVAESHMSDAIRRVPDAVMDLLLASALEGEKK